MFYSGSSITVTTNKTEHITQSTAYISSVKLNYWFINRKIAHLLYAVDINKMLLVRYLCFLLMCKSAYLSFVYRIEPSCLKR